MKTSALGSFLVAFAIGAALMLLWACAPPAHSASIEPIKPSAYWKNRLTREARQVWGPDAPIATFAAQIDQESGWNPQALSKVGAQGMAQFMPATAAWISTAYPALADNTPQNPVWAIRALVTYDYHLWQRTAAVDGCNHMAKVLSSYNGGLGWIVRDETLAQRHKLNPGIWWASVETVNAGRNIAAWRENRGYPKRILQVIEPRYINAAWVGGSCN